MERRKRRSFTPKFRAEAVRLVREGSKNLPQVAKDLDLTESALRNQVREADGAEGKNPAAGALTGAEREELVRLRKENRQLTMERDFLKNSSRPVPHRLLRKKLGAPTTTGLRPGGP
jgi:transposase